MRRILSSLCLAACAAALLAIPARAAVLVSDFGSISSQLFPPMHISWTQAGTDQYTQSSDFISIAPVGGGNPKGDGYFLAGMPGRSLDHPETSALNFTGLSFFDLTARVDAGNASSIMNIVIYDDEFTQIGSATFQAADLSSSFTTISQAITYTGSGHVNLATYFRIDGDGVAANNFRYSFSDLAASAVPIPEPSTTLLISAALGLLLFGRKALRHTRSCKQYGLQIQPSVES